ncbi:Do family serine endopeptidase [Pseudosulfitobacter koreensis]|uniref:Probable periplasmic serine endoprotease DegP-like n=1 Tax=Pseudosulfitobacter koreensis TaxID=2968472 RepID=A0ABT1YZR8_9RHOB|nr:Do family serine endopeptidase [Pseudosulfitobacter koreense]MCR8826357.1 Do family serine endopeptidase [Pseudosulfitobacter koreense]
MNIPTFSGISAVAVAATLALTPAPSIAQEANVSPPQDFTEIVAELSPAVVGITARGVAAPRRAMPGQGMPGPFGQTPEGQTPQRETVAGGSGFMISDEGYIVTNNHVVEGATQLEILLEDGSTRAAELIGTDPATDIAVLQIADASDIAVASWGDSDAMQPGAWTIAIGSPFGLGGTVTVGVLSATSRVIGAGPYDAFLQTDASINSGNSGGPLFNTSGEVIGVNTAIFSPGGGNVGIGFAVPTSIAQNVVQQLIDTGEVERGFIGVNLQGVTDPLARAIGLEDTQGAIVTRVEPGAPAEAAGIRAGDVILSIDGTMAEDARDISRMVADIAPGSEVPVTVFRDGEQIEVTLTLAERNAAAQPESTEMPAESAMLGLAVSPVPELVRRNLGLQEGEALMVQNVQSGSPAAEAGLRQGDVILSAGDESISSADVLSEAWSEARAAGRPLLLQVNRGGNTVYLAVEPDDDAGEGQN